MAELIAFLLGFLVAWVAIEISKPKLTRKSLINQALDFSMEQGKRTREAVESIHIIQGKTTPENVEERMDLMVKSAEELGKYRGQAELIAHLMGVEIEVVEPDADEEETV